MILDCESCTMRNIACSDCVVTTLLGPIETATAHEDMFTVLANAGLTRPLRLIHGEGEIDSSHSATG